jgi:hypothetical protein
LCIHQAVSEELLKAWNSTPSIPRQRVASDIYETCPRITELDLSRNLFRTFREVAAICEQLEQVKTLRIDGNRFSSVSMTPIEAQHFNLIFGKVESLSLESTLLGWEETVRICACFPALKTLSISGNEFDRLETKSYDVSLEKFPAITSIKLESNTFTSLSDIALLKTIPSLRHIILKYNSISAVNTSQTPLIFSHITGLDVSFNAITTWAFINDLSTAFPSLTSLRISHNPLFSNLHNPAGRELTAEDGYMLTIARLPNLRILNFSAVTEKDRLNAESYYLSLIVQELSLAAEMDADRIKAQHPRWEELCSEYGEPEIKRTKDHVDPRSLAARLLTLEFELSDTAAVLFRSTEGKKAVAKNIPKRFSIYSVLGSVVKAFGQSIVTPGLSLSLITDDWADIDGERVKREIRLVPETRGIGTFIEERVGRIRVDYEEPVQDHGAYKHPLASVISASIVI